MAQELVTKAKEARISPLDSPLVLLGSMVNLTKAEAAPVPKPSPETRVIERAASSPRDDRSKESRPSIATSATRKDPSSNVFSGTEGRRVSMIPEDSHPPSHQLRTQKPTSPQRPILEVSHVPDRGDDILHQQRQPQKHRVVKSQKKNSRAQSPAPTAAPRSTTSPNKVISSEQLLKMFMFRTRQEEKQRDQRLQELQERNAQLEEIADNYDSMQHAVEAAQEQFVAQQAALEKYQLKVNGLKAKFGNIHKHIQGLTTDGNKSRDEMTQLNAKLQDLVHAKAELKAAILQERAEFQRTLKAKNRMIAVAAVDIEELQGRLQSQEEDLVNHNELLDYERKRNDDLSGKLTEMWQEISGHSNLVLQSLGANQSDLIKKIDELSKAQNFEAQSAKENESRAAITTELQYIKDILQELRGREVIGLNDLKTLETTIETTNNR